MIDKARAWIVTERNFLHEDLRWLQAGAKVFSPSGENITGARARQLVNRIAHADQILLALDEGEQQSAEN